MTTPTQRGQVFISYSLKDEAPFSSLCLALESAGLQYWEGRLKAGESLKDQLRDAISKCDVCIFIATKNSVTSKWCLNEIGAFWGAGKRIILYAANHDIEQDLPPLFKGDFWTSNAREVINQVREELAAVTELRNQANGVGLVSAATRVGANIVCLEVKKSELVMVDNTFYDLKDHQYLHEHTLDSAIVELENQPILGRRIEPLISVEAQIIFYDEAGDIQERIEGAAWVGERCRRIDLEVGRRKKLVIGYEDHHEDYVRISVVQNNRDTPDSKHTPTFSVLDGNRSRAYVRLLANGEIVKEMYFELALMPSLFKKGRQLSIKKSIEKPSR